MRFLLAALVLFSAASQASSLDRALLKSVMQRASPAFKRCYEAALRRDGPALEGKARLTLTVEADGRVSEVTVEFPLVAGDFTRCLREGAMKLRFPKGPAPFRVVWPVDFTPG